MSAITRKFRFWTAVCLILSLLLNVAPLAAYTIMGFVEADLVVEKVGLAATIFIVLIMTAIAWINKTTMRSRVWILLLGMYFCLHNFITPLIIVAICQVIDEWFISPLHKYCRERYVINKELDRR
jgi:hypothetical protein